MGTSIHRVAVVADDLIWASRLIEAVRRGGGEARPTKSEDELRHLLADATAPIDAVLVDLNGRRYDGVEAVRTAAASGRVVIAVGQHEDQALRRRALDAGARRVYSYNKLFRDGPDVVRSLLEVAA